MAAKVFSLQLDRAQVAEIQAGRGSKRRVQLVADVDRAAYVYVDLPAGMFVDLQPRAVIRQDAFVLPSDTILDMQIGASQRIVVAGDPQMTGIVNVSIEVEFEG
jgi:hypothetical protein